MNLPSSMQMPARLLTDVSHNGGSTFQQLQQGNQVASNVAATMPTVQTQGVAGMADQARGAMTAVNTAGHGERQALQAAAAEQMQRNTLAALSPAQLAAHRYKQIAAQEIGATGAMEALGQHLVRNELQKLGLA